MNKLKILAFTLLAIVSCRKSDEGEVTPPAPVSVNENTFSIKVKDLFSTPGKVEDSRRKLSNIRVGDMIPYEIEISDTAEEAVYSFFAVEEGTKFHQVLNKDYQLHIDAKDGEVELDPKQGIIKFPKKGTYTFYIKPLLAGTYRLLFNFQKQKEGKVVGKNLSQEILFNAVNVNVWLEAKRKSYMPLEYENKFFFSIDDGADQDDIYLTSREGIYHRYHLKMHGKEYSGEFNQGNINFRVEETQINYKDILDIYRSNGIPVRLEQLRIVQVMPDRKEVEIDYYDLIINF